MAESKFIKSKKAPASKPTTPRSMAEINTEYTGVTAAAGELQYKILNMQHSLTLANQKISELHAEANARQEIESKSAPAQAEVAHEQA